MPKVEINGEKLEFPTEEALNGYLAAISAPKEQTTLDKVKGFTDKVNPYLGGIASAGLAGPLLTETYLQRRKMTAGENPATAFLENARNAALLNKYPELVGLANQATTTMTNAQPTDPELLKQYPELANVGQSYSQRRDQERAELNRLQSDYPGSSLLGSGGGMMLGAPAAAARTMAAKYIPEGAGLLRRVLGNAGINATLGQAMAPLESSTGDRLTQGGIDVAASVLPDTLIGVLGKYSQMREMGRGIEMGPIDAPIQPGYTPYKDGVDPRMMAARDEIAAKQGIQIPMTAEQGLQNPGLLQRGVNDDVAVAQRQAGERVAGQLEVNAGLQPNAAQLNETDIGGDLGGRLASAKEESNRIISQKFEALKPDLATNKRDVFVPNEINKVIEEIKTEASRGAGTSDRGVLEFINILQDNGLAGSTKKFFVRSTGQELAQAEAAELSSRLSSGAFPNNKSFIVEKQVPNKLSLDNLQKLRQEVMDKQGENPAMFTKLKKAIDKEIDAYAQNVSSKNPELGNRVKDVIKEWKTNNQKFENNYVGAMINDMKQAAQEGGPLLNTNPAGAARRIFGALEKGDLNAIRSIEAVLGPDSTKEVRQRFAQRILRGNSPNLYDLEGITQRLNFYSKKNEEVLKHMLGQDYITYRNLGYIADKMKPAVANYQKGRLLPSNVRGHGGATMTILNHLWSKHSNDPRIVELMLRNNKKVITPAMSSFIAKQMVNRLFEIESAMNNEDPLKKVDTSE